MARKIFFLLAILFIASTLCPVSADEAPSYRYVLLGFQLPDNLSEEQIPEEIEKVGGLILHYGKKYSRPEHQWMMLQDGKEFSIEIDGPPVMEFRQKEWAIWFQPNSLFEIHSPVILEEGIVLVRLRLKINGEWQEEPGRETGYRFIIKKIEEKR